MRRFVLWTTGIVVGLWIARELVRPAGQTEKRPTRIDLNLCSREDLIRIAGLTEGFADRIVENRPYRHRLDLVARMVVPSGIYREIRELVDVEAAAVGRPVNVAVG